MKRFATAFEWVLFLPTLLPLFYVEGMMYPLMTPKTLALRALFVIALALFAYLAVSGKRFFWQRLKDPRTWLPGGLLLLAYGTSLIGTDFYHSFWSTYERGDGLLTLTACVGYFYLVLLSADGTWLRRFFKWIAWVGALSAVYLILQWLVVAGGLHIPFIVKPNGRVGGAMGNAAFLAAYLGLTFFASLAAARDSREWRARVLYVGAVLELFAIFLTGTRGTLLALVAVGFAFLVYLALRGSPAVRTAARYSVLIALVGAAAFFAFRGPLSHSSFTPIARVASISVSDPTVASRLFLWKSISKESLPHALTGYGAEHISVPFDRVYDPSAIEEEWFDRSHNAYLDYFVQFGIGGVLLYVALIALIILLGTSLMRAGDAYGLLILGLGSVYAIQNFFVFDTGVTLWLFLALIAMTYVHRHGGSDGATLTVQPRPVIAVLIGTLLALLVIPVAFMPLRANLLAFESYQYQIADVARSNAAASRALALGTYADLELAYNAYFMYTEQQLNRLTGTDLERAYENAVMLLGRSFDRYPYDARTAVYLSQVLSSAPSGTSANSELLSEALARSIKESPKRSQPWYILTNLSIAEANTHPIGSAERAAGYASARDILSRYITLVPRLSRPHFVLAQLLYASGDKAGAATAAEEGKAYYREDLETARRAAVYYETVLDLNNAAYFLSEVVRLDPTDEAAASDLAQIRSYESNK